MGEAGLLYGKIIEFDLAGLPRGCRETKYSPSDPAFAFQVAEIDGLLYSDEMQKLRPRISLGLLL
jgi:hypothetical protein